MQNKEAREDIVTMTRVYQEDFLFSESHWKNFHVYLKKKDETHWTVVEQQNPFRVP